MAELTGRGAIELFERVNAARLQQLYDVLKPKQQEFIRLLPFFFHVNHALIPGFVSSKTPSGVRRYEPAKNDLMIVKGYARSFTYSKVVRHEILAIYLMGSAGTTAYNKHSDIDIWICYDHRLTKEQIKNLQKKATLIELEASHLDLEVHFFLMNAESFRQGGTAELSSESSGTA